ncbi:actin-related protein 10-like [Tubulanus polymorphus]|uniref:actin-related protein 10-like n=1 Tax=Tubulanus polymorphus TaxID=672921 RepID=UPI003DA3DAE1
MPLFEGIGFTSEKTAVILDIGAAYTKCGFAGEIAPRCIIQTKIKNRSGQEVNFCKSTNPDELFELLKNFLHKLYFRHLLVNPKDRRVVICESLLAPAYFRDTLARVLFKHYEVPSVLFAPHHQLSLFTLGNSSGLVMDLGYSETLVIPIYEGIPVLKAWESVPLGGEALHSRLEKILLETATVTTDQDSEKPLSSAVSSLSEKVLEDIKVRCCFVTKLERAKLIQDNALKAHGFKEGDKSELPPPPPGVKYPLDGGKMLFIEGRIRENLCELLFEQDNEEKSVATLILDSILKCPIDMRRYMAENLVITGGTSMLPGFKARLKDELISLSEQPKYKNKLTLGEFKFHELPAKENYAAWLGGALFGALEILAGRSLTKEKYKETGLIPDWASIAKEPEAEEEKTAPLRQR